MPKTTHSLTANAELNSAPETIRFNRYARQMAADLLAGPAVLRRRAVGLAVKVGLTG